jgi:hypothetical protein
VPLRSLFEETEMEMEIREAGKMDMKQFLNCIDELEYYNLIKLERNKKDVKMSLVGLNCDMNELDVELEKLTKS